MGRGLTVLSSIGITKPRAHLPPLTQTQTLHRPRVGGGFGRGDHGV